MKSITLRACPPLARSLAGGHDINPPAFWRVKKDISMLMPLTRDNSVAFNKGQGEC